MAANIAAFGGDPGAITAAGQSAGAHSVAALAVSSTTRPLTNKLILQSSAPRLRPQPLAEASAAAAAFLEQLGADPRSLRTLAVDELLSAHGRVGGGQLGGANPSTPMRVVATDAGARDLATTLVEDLASEVPVLAGTALHEQAAFYRQVPALVALDESGALKLLGAHFGADAGPALYERYRGFLTRATAGEVFEQVSGDAMFLAPLLDVAARRSGDTYGYRFDWAGSRFGACHCIELPFLFGNLASWAGSPMLAGIGAREFEAVGAPLRAAFGAFVRTGRPGADAWCAYGGARRTTMRFDAEPELVDDLSGSARQIFADVDPQPWVAAHQAAKA